MLEVGDSRCSHMLRILVCRACTCAHDRALPCRAARSEFMFLMLGETVLQIVIAAGHPPSDLDTSRLQDWYASTRAAALCGFVLAVCMMHSFRSVVVDALDGAHHVNGVCGSCSSSSLEPGVGPCQLPLARRHRVAARAPPPSHLLSNRGGTAVVSQHSLEEKQLMASIEKCVADRLVFTCHARPASAAHLMPYT